MHKTNIYESIDSTDCRSRVKWMTQGVSRRGIVGSEKIDNILRYV